MYKKLLKENPYLVVIIAIMNPEETEMLKTVEWELDEGQDDYIVSECLPHNTWENEEGKV